MRRNVRKMLPSDELPLTRIVSMRLNDREWEELMQTCESSGMTVSDCLREAMGFSCGGRRRRSRMTLPQLSEHAGGYLVLMPQ